MPPPPISRNGLGVRSFSLGLLLALLWLILCRHLSGEWSINEQYSYGWFVPFFAAYLFWLRWEDRPDQGESGNAKVEISRGKDHRPKIGRRTAFLLSTSTFLLLLLTLLPLRLFEVGNPDWRPLGWVHAVIVVTITLLVIWRAGGAAWVKHFAFPVLFILVAVPWVTPIEAPIVQGLMRVVAAIATETLALCGIPAQLQGSVIRIGSGVVGVNEACSGVRSLQTSLMIGLLFGELKRLSVSGRILLVLGATVIALVANCARAFFLVWIAATKDLEAVARWHDPAGYAILGAVFLGTVLLASLLGKSEVRRQTSEINAKIPVPLASDFRPLTSSSSFLLHTSYFLLALGWLLLVEIGVEAWYRAHEHNLVATPTWSVRWLEGAPGFEEIAISDDVAVTLRYDAGRQARWRVSLDPVDSASTLTPALCSMFFFRWEPGTTSILRARAHRPDVCLPNTGWRIAQDFGVQTYPVGDGTAMPFRHFSFARPAAENREVTAHTFFCQREDRIPALQARQFNLNAGETEWSRSDRVRVVLQGLRNQGQQVLEIVFITPRAIGNGTVEAEFAKLIPQIVRLDSAQASTPRR